MAIGCFLCQVNLESCWLLGLHEASWAPALCWTCHAFFAVWRQLLHGRLDATPSYLALRHQLGAAIPQPAHRNGCQWPGAASKEVTADIVRRIVEKAMNGLLTCAVWWVLTLCLNSRT